MKLTKNNPARGQYAALISLVSTGQFISWNISSILTELIKDKNDPFLVQNPCLNNPIHL